MMIVVAGDRRVTVVQFVMTSLMMFGAGLMIGIVIPINNNASYHRRASSSVGLPKFEIHPDDKLVKNSDHRSSSREDLLRSSSKRERKTETNETGGVRVDADWSDSGHQLNPAERQYNSSDRRTGSLIMRPPGAPYIIRPPDVPLDDDDNDLADRRVTQQSIYWSRQLESLTPSGFSDRELRSWRNFAKNATIRKMEFGCGRMQNKLLTFENGSRACCRYRHNNDQIQGEIFSFYLSRILGIKNVPPSTLSMIGQSNDQWSSVRNSVAVNRWDEHKPVVLTKFVDNLKPAYIPTMLRRRQRRLHPVDLTGNLTDAILIDLVQWTDLILFDYLTANLDRVVNNMFNEQWNPDMMDSPAHNLGQIIDGSIDRLLLFIDNESGLLHGYRLLDKYERYQKALLDSVCVFRRSTADAIFKLNRNKNIGRLLNDMMSEFDPEMIDWLPGLPAKNIKMLNRRISTVYKHIMKCTDRYPSR